MLLLKLLDLFMHLFLEVLEEVLEDEQEIKTAFLVIYLTLG